LAVVDDPTPVYQQIRELTEPVTVSGRSHAGFNPASAEQVRLFQTVLDGDHLLRGFRDGDIRAALYGSTEDQDERRHRSHAVGRMLKRLRVRGLIVKVPHSHRWHVSDKGHRILGAVVRLYHDGIPATLAHAAQFIQNIRARCRDVAKVDSNTTVVTSLAVQQSVSCNGIFSHTGPARTLGSSGSLG
jgi:hypothetical protein